MEPKCTKLSWQNRGSKATSPYTTFSVDHGSMLGKERGGGPETVQIWKVLPKQYDIGVDCFSCDAKEVQVNGLTLDKPIPLTYSSLKAFRNSKATVKVYRGRKLVFCERIGSVQGHPHAFWDVVSLVCDGADCKIMKQNKWEKKSPTVKALQGPPRGKGKRHAPFMKVRI